MTRQEQLVNPTPTAPELSRRLGVFDIVFMVIAAAAPVTVVVANIPIILTESGSLGAPLMILAATVILLLFSVGYTWMTPHVPDAGAFYSYVDKGMGTRAGLGTAGIALFSYTLLTVSMTCYLGVQLGNLISRATGGALELPWWVISAVMILIVALLGYRDIALSAKMLGIVLILEVLAVVALDLGVLASGRPLVSEAFSPAEALSGAPGLGLLFAFLGFFGFEATAVFRSEAKDPDKTVPRATYTAVIAVGILYTVSAWLVISGLGADRALEDAAAHPDSVVIDLTSQVVFPMMADILQVLVVTSMFACMLAFHNIVTRYLFTLGQRRVLHPALGQVHPRHRAPSTASLWVSILTALIIFASAAFQLDPVAEIYTWYSGAGAVGVVAMMALASSAVLVYGRTKASTSVKVLTGLGALGLVLVLTISVANFPMMVGGVVASIIWGILLIGSFIAGYIWRVPSADPEDVDEIDAAV